eukprot:gb/GEZN01006625.1/.p1 GENE.gb/GEZN01006625.1/~~gb/GEZN01006625.1/.p1  ORF type:complete len:473 (-),score=46.01 gb/GEZN01006625.1/:195-1613(-)
MGRSACTKPTCLCLLAASIMLLLFTSFYYPLSPLAFSQASFQAVLASQSVAAARAARRINGSLARWTAAAKARLENPTDILLVIPSVARRPPHNPLRYLTRTILSVVRTCSETGRRTGGREPACDVRLVVLNTEQNHNDHDELNQLEAAGLEVVALSSLPSTFRVFQSPSLASPREENRQKLWLISHDSEYAHYVSALRLCLSDRFNLTPTGMCVVLQDDVLVHPNFFPVLAEFTSQAGFWENWTYLRLHLPLQWGKWNLLEPNHLLELLFSGVFSFLVVYLAFITVAYAQGKVLSPTYWLDLIVVGLISGPVLALVVGRVHWLQLAGPWFYEHHGFHVVSAKKCCLAGAVYPRLVLPALVAWLEQQDTMSRLLKTHFPPNLTSLSVPPPPLPPPLHSLFPLAIDLTIHRWAVSSGLGLGKYGPGRIEPNLVAHIGLYSSLARPHLGTPYRQQELQEQWYVNTYDNTEIDPE